MIKRYTHFVRAFTEAEQLKASQAQAVSDESESKNQKPNLWIMKPVGLSREIGRAHV
jgi:hypothetical protein